jgi:hypothetical protein
MKHTKRYRHQSPSVPYPRQRVWQVLLTVSLSTVPPSAEHKFVNIRVCHRSQYVRIMICKVGRLELKYREVKVCSCHVTRIQDNMEGTTDKSFEFKVYTKDSNKY